MPLVRNYCCCAIPLLNAGIYITLTEQLVVAITAGILTFATPALVGVSIPGFAPTIFGILCFIVAAVQLIGYFGVIRESTTAFRRYTTLHLLSILAVFAYSAAFIAVSATKHSTASSKCVNTFFPPDASATATSFTGADTEGKTLCNIFTWVNVGLLAALWVVLAVFHLYLYLVVTGYGAVQRDDHSKYYALYSFNSFPAGSQNPLRTSDTIGLNNMDAWDTRESMDTVGFEKQNAQYAGVTSTYPPASFRQDGAYGGQQRY
ncbi:hypothetical protein Clacol_003839 [Clathrus columnatus]|uniref:Uncharacterized protein n=1 Tax=Clathrus columnatus TaxID=1419009 RepID=A0AAV5A4P1_9AGAM|nr:hypothetical protein Clacol_003839 [Clathrus columnatus]